MSLKETLVDEMKSALRAKDEVKLSTIRLARSAIRNKEIDLGRELTDEDIMAVLSTEARKRQEAIEGAERAGRADVAAREQKELEVLKRYLPEQIGESELEEIVKGIISEIGAAGMRDKGRVMSLLMPRIRGKADGRLASELVDRLLA